MIVTDIYNHRFHRIFATNENLSSIMERDDIYVWVRVGGREMHNKPNPRCIDIYIYDSNYGESMLCILYKFRNT